MLVNAFVGQPPGLRLFQGLGSVGVPRMLHGAHGQLRYDDRRLPRYGT